VQTDAIPLALDLRSLFRDSEARAARLKLLIDVSRDLAAVESPGLHAAVAQAAQRAALFAGYGAGAVQPDSMPAGDDALIIPLSALAERGRPGMSLVFSCPMNPAAIAAQEDADALRLLVELIEARLTVDLHRRKEARLLERLERREKELEQVLSRVVGAQESERAAISADLHDSVAQQVAAMHRRLELVHLDLAERNPTVAADVKDLIGIARKAVSDLRGVIAGLRPPSLDDLGVAAALREDARRLETAGHKVSVSDRLDRRLPTWLETLLFRVAQEAFNNVAKHAPGASVSLDLMLDPEQSAVLLTVENAGGRPAEIAETSETPRFGLEMMRERLMAVAGSLEADPTPTGYRIRALVPLTGA
jgi:two-component system NarL family sensor kinase